MLRCMFIEVGDLLVLEPFQILGDVITDKVALNRTTVVQRSDNRLFGAIKIDTDRFFGWLLGRCRREDGLLTMWFG